MSAAALTAEREVVTPLGELSDQQADLGRSALSSHVGTEASEARWMRRLGLRADGEWMLSVRHMTPGVPGFEKTVGTHGPQIAKVYYPLAEGVRLVREGAEASADRLAKARADLAAEIAAKLAEEKDRQRRQLEENQRREREWSEVKERFHYDRWVATPEWAQVFFSEALIWAPTHPDQARKMRELAQPAIGRAGKRGEVGGDLPFPARVWWEP